MATRTADEMLRDYTAAMGPTLGPAFHRCNNDNVECPKVDTAADTCAMVRLCVRRIVSVMLGGERVSHSTSFRSIRVGLVLTAAVGLQTADRIEAVQIPLDAVVQFGAAHPQPDPPAHHFLSPEEVTILKGGTVTFQVNGGAHGVAIYPVSKHTTREDILADLCPSGPGAPACAGATAHAPFFITDGKGDLIVDTGAFLPTARAAFDYAPGRLLAAIGGSAVFLNGSTGVTVPPATVPAPGVRLVQTFPKAGRFLVICMNRFHLINDYMFGFVTVVGRDDQ